MRKLFFLILILSFHLSYSSIGAYYSISAGIFCPGIAQGIFKAKQDYCYAGIRVSRIYKMICGSSLIIRFLYDKQIGHRWKLVSLTYEEGKQKIVESDYIEEIPPLSEESIAYFGMPKIKMMDVIGGRPFTCMYSYETEIFLEDIILYTKSDIENISQYREVTNPQIAEQCVEFIPNTTGRFKFYVMNENPPSSWMILDKINPPHIYEVIIDVAGNCTGCMALGIDALLLEDIPNADWAYFQIYF